MYIRKKYQGMVRELLEKFNENGFLCYNDIKLLYENDYHNWRVLCKDICKECNNIFSLRMNDCVNRINNNLPPLCKRCGQRKLLFDNPVWLKKNRDAQLISQNKPETKLKNSNGVKKFWQNNPEIKKIVKDKVIKAYEKNPEKSASSRFNGILFNTKFGDIKFESYYEFLYIIMCVNNVEVINLKRWDKPGIKYIDEDNKIRRYYPDFIINNKTIVEIKSNYFYKICADNIKLKSDSCKKEYPEFRYCVIDEGGLDFCYKGRDKTLLRKLHDDFGDNLVFYKQKNKNMYDEIKNENKE